MIAQSVKTNIYVDGFNLYYGALRGSRYKWLDIAALCRQILLPHHQLNRIRYFSARVISRPEDPQQNVRQQMYFRALETIPNLTIHLGHFLSHAVKMRSALKVGPAFLDVIKTEEKGSDVNLASHLLVDGFEGDYEAAVVITNDSDLQTPIEMVRTRLGKDVGIINPHSRNPSIQLKKVAKFSLAITEAALQDSQFPETILDAGKRIIRKPTGW